ncbi:MAG: S46 family peptidase [Acidobacteria bacterium]|nr:S46 family peptidase [Acidobacteriota bacterium]
MITSRTALLVSAVFMTALRADEGMWTFDNVPTKRIKAAYGVDVDQAFLDRLRLATVRFPGATGSFVSAEGLVLTNHHVGRGAIQQVSDAEHDYIRDGFTASSRKEEKKVAGLVLITLEKMRDVTKEVGAAVKPGMAPAVARKAREAALLALQQAEQKATGLQVESVSLYNGGETWLYGYKRHTDVRLVAAPEAQMAAFGGDPDNFVYPRHDLDFSLFRVYENDQPYKPAAFLPFNAGGAKVGEPVFISGHPGATARQETLAQMAFARDHAIPFNLKSWKRRHEALLRYGATSPEARRTTQDQVYGLENNLKRWEGFLRTLRDRDNWDRLEKQEKELKAAVAKHGGRTAAAAWESIAQAVDREKGMMKARALVGTLGSQTLSYALTLVQAQAERAKPADQRLPEFSEARLKSTETRILNPKPIEVGVDKALMLNALQEALEILPNHPFTKAVLKGRTPEQVVAAAFGNTKVLDVAERKRLWERGVSEATDEMLNLARAIDPILRAQRKQYEDEVESITKEQGGRLAQARFEIFGHEAYPDATFTLRLSYGKVDGFPANGTLQAPFTTFAGLYDRAWGMGPDAENGAWKLSPRWVDAWKKLDLTTPYNFAYSADTIGGNSGSPVVNAKGEVVGLNFDGNQEKLGNRYVYDVRTMRAVAVDTRAILEALTKVFEAPHLAQELKAGRL